MTHVCPHCHQPMRELRYGVAFGETALRIIDMVERAGAHGIDQDVLFWAVYAERKAKRTALKSNINSINDKLESAGKRLMCVAKSYRMVTTDAEVNHSKHDWTLLRQRLAGRVA